MAGSNWNLLAFSLGLLLLTILITRLATHFRSRLLRTLATQQQMRFSAVDRFNLATRAGPSLGLGAADLRVRDLMYRIEAGGYVYVFTAEFALGSINGLRRRRLVVRGGEPAGRSGHQLVDVRLADGTLPLRKQYQSLLAEVSSLDEQNVKT